MKKNKSVKFDCEQQVTHKSSSRFTIKSSYDTPKSSTNNLRAKLVEAKK